MSDAQLNLLFLLLCLFPWEVVAALLKCNTDRSQLPGIRSGKCVTQENSVQTDAALE